LNVRSSEERRFCLTNGLAHAEEAPGPRFRPSVGLLWTVFVGCADSSDRTSEASLPPSCRAARHAGAEPTAPASGGALRSRATPCPLRPAPWQMAHPTTDVAWDTSISSHSQEPGESVSNPAPGTTRNPALSVAAFDRGARVGSRRKPTRARRVFRLTRRLGRLTCRHDFSR